MRRQYRYPLLEVLAIQAELEAPYEGVGVIFGPEGSAQDMLHWQFVELENEAPLDQATRRCWVSAEQMRPTMARAQERGLELRAWWHSHPVSAAIPSETDLDNWRVPLCLITTNMPLRHESQRTRAWHIYPGQKTMEVAI